MHMHSGYVVVHAASPGLCWCLPHLSRLILVDVQSTDPTLMEKEIGRTVRLSVEECLPACNSEAFDTTPHDLAHRNFFQSS